MGVSSSSPTPPPSPPQQGPARKYYVHAPTPKPRKQPPKPSTPPPPTRNPWRQPAEWNKELENKLRDDIKSVYPVEKPSIVLMGPVGSGKSSFVNAILTIAKGHKVDMATTKTGSKSCTTSYDKYTAKSLLQQFRLRDCMGIEQGQEDGFHVDDMRALLKGHIKDGYEFNPRSPITPIHQKYRKKPKFKHQVHCIVFVVDSNVVNVGIPSTFVSKIKEIQDEIKILRIPRVLILTKADTLCQEVQKDDTNMFRSVKVKETVKIASEVFNIPESSIHPVTNYEDLIEVDFKRNIPLLLALRQAVEYANDRIDAIKEHSDSDSDSD